MRALKVLLATAAVCTSLAFIPTAKAQISVGIDIGGPPPVCQWGYYDYSPYGCAPSGYYGPGYFYNGIFLGVGPWSNWGYAHGWGGHRFSNAGGGRYVPGNRGGGGEARGGGGNARGGGGGHAAAAPRGGGGNAHGGGGHAAAAPRGGGGAHGGGGHAAAPKGGGGAHGGGGHASGGGHAGGGGGEHH